MSGRRVDGVLSRADAFRAAGGRVDDVAAPAPVRPVPLGPRPPAPPTAPASSRPARGQVLLDVPLDELHPDPANPRGDVGDVSELAATMERLGLVHPVLARRDSSGRLYVVAGHRRLAAARRLGWRVIPTTIRRDMPGDLKLATMIVENEDRKRLDPIEVARGYQALRDEGKSLAQIAALIGRTEATVSRTLRLLLLPIHEQEALRAGQITHGEAQEKATAAGQVKRGQIAPGQPRKVQTRATAHHFGAGHALAHLAKERCGRLAARKPDEHRVKLAGAVACGPCWEAVIRADAT